MGIGQMVPPVGQPVGPDIQFPTRRQRIANNLYTVDGKNDAEIGVIMGCARETVCRLRAEFRRRVHALQQECAARGVRCQLILEMAG